MSSVRNRIKVFNSEKIISVESNDNVSGNNSRTNSVLSSISSGYSSTCSSSTTSSGYRSRSSKEDDVTSLASCISHDLSEMKDEPIYENLPWQKNEILHQSHKYIRSLPEIPPKQNRSNMNRPESEYSMVSYFSKEPLYQTYNEDLERRNLIIQDLNISTGTAEEQIYALIEDNFSDSSELARTIGSKISPSCQSSLWCEDERVKSSGVLNSLSRKEKTLQEAKYEIISSEASYLKSLNVLINHFKKSYEFICTSSPKLGITTKHIQTIFNPAQDIRNVSKNFLEDLKSCWREDFMMKNLSSVILKHAKKNFSVYIQYCRNKPYQEDILKKLKENEESKKYLLSIESKETCNNLPLISFTILPMQRITKLPLLLDAIVAQLDQHNLEINQYQSALTEVRKIASMCNKTIGQSERQLEMQNINESLYYDTCISIAKLSVANDKRWLIKKGKMKRLIVSDPKKFSLFKWTMESVHIFLFNDLLLVTEFKTRKQKYKVCDYCDRNMITMSQVQNLAAVGVNLPETIQNLFRLTLLQNRDKKEVEFILFCPPTDAGSNFTSYTRWMDVLNPQTSESSDEKIYEEWDCPKVQAIKPYTATDHDELSLDVADIINVLKKMNDGWWFGERTSDGRQGWFPAEIIKELPSSHLHARHLKQRYSFLQCALKIQTVRN